MSSKDIKYSVGLESGIGASVSSVFCHTGPGPPSEDGF